MEAIHMERRGFGDFWNRILKSTFNPNPTIADVNRKDVQVELMLETFVGM